MDPQSNAGESAGRAGGRPLRIGIDVHTIGFQKTGNERFITNIVRELRGLCDHELFLYFGAQDAAESWPEHPRTHPRAIAGSRLARVAVLLPRAARRDNLDVLLVQYTAGSRVPCPVVPVVHDVSFATDAAASFFSTIDRLRMRFTIPRTMRRAPCLITVSEFSRAEISRIFGIPRDRIFVAPNAPDPSILRPAAGPSEVQGPYFLFLGNIERRKNLVMLIEAFARLRAEHPEVPERLVIVGKNGFGSPEVRRAATALATPSVEFTGYVPDSQLAAMLAGATALTYPSVYEGFGLPVLEAMAAGVPALASDIPVMREVAADAAMLLPPRDSKAWAEGLRAIATDPQLRADMISRGRVRAAGFSWTDSAQVVLECLERAAAEKT